MASSNTSSTLDLARRNGMTPERPVLGVVVSYYDARSSQPLRELLVQLVAERERRNLDARSPFSIELLVVVNQDRPEQSATVEVPPGVRVVERPNAGFNIGAWDAGWRLMPGARHIVFLQDECEIASRTSLERYWRLLEEHGGNALVGESLLVWPSWATFRSRWPGAFAKVEQLARYHHIELGATSSHLQTLALGCSMAALQGMQGLVTADDKVEAIACEVLVSRRAVSRGLKLLQSSWRPFACFAHPQWEPDRVRARRIAWSIKRAVKLVGLRLASVT